MASELKIISARDSQKNSLKIKHLMNNFCQYEIVDYTVDRDILWVLFRFLLKYLKVRKVASDRSIVHFNGNKDLYGVLTWISNRVIWKYLAQLFHDVKYDLRFLREKNGAHMRHFELKTAGVGLIILQNLFYTWKCMEICNEQRIINILSSELIYL